MAYVLVEFDKNDGGGISTLHRSWLTPRKQEAFWPPFKDQYQFDKALKSGAPINTETWKLYKIHRVFYESDDLAKVKSKGREAELTSNLESEAEEFSQKRKRKVNTCRYPISSDEESTSNLPRPPSVKWPRSNPSVSGTVEAITIQSQSQTNTSVFSCDSEKMNKLISLVATIKEQNNEILEWIRKQDSRILKPTSTRPNLSVELPLKTLDELDRLEEDLRKSDSDSNDLVSYLSTLGGKDTVTRTNRILKYLFKDVVASSFSYYGERSNKRPFLDLILKNMIIDAVKLSSPQSTDRDVEESIKVWLKHAPERIKKHGARQEN